MPGGRPRAVGRPATDALLTLALAAGLAALVVGGLWGSEVEGYAAARAIHVPLFALVVIAGAAGGLLLLRTPRWRRPALICAAFAVVIALDVMFYQGVLRRGDEEVARVDSPNGGRSLVVHPLEARVETGRGLGRRYRIVGCTNGDAGFFGGGRWVDDDTVVIAAADGEGGLRVRLTGPASAQEASPPTSPCGE